MICYIDQPLCVIDLSYKSSSKYLIMKQITSRLSILALLILGALITKAQAPISTNLKTVNSTEMKTYVIEREIPGAGKLTAEQLKGISQTSCSVLKEMGPRIQWIHSYVSENRIVCIYKAENMELIREHGKKGGFPVTSITEIGTVISPATAQ